MNTADFTFRQSCLQQSIVLRQGIAFCLIVPEVVRNAGKFQIMAFHTVMIATGDKFAVFPAPTDKAIVKPVDGKRIAAEKAHIAGFDAFVFAVAFSACQFGQTTAAQGGKPFFYP